MRKRRLVKRQDTLEAAIETALQPGRFIRYGAGWDFVSGLEGVAGEIEKLARSNAARAVRLYETFLGGCYEKAEEIDDSSGNFGEFMQELLGGWVRARQAAGADPDDTAARLVRRMAEDRHGFCYRLERGIVKAFDAPGLAAFARASRARFDAAPGPGSPPARPADPGRSLERWAEVLRVLLRHQRDLDGYLALAAETGATAADCREVAAILIGKGEAGGALEWVERGLSLAKENGRLHSEEFDLRRMRRDLLVALGRGEEAIAEVWAEFRAHPSAYTYADLMKLVPEGDRALWHAKAIDAADSADLQSLLHLLAETVEVDRLAAAVRRATDAGLEGVSHHVGEPAAARLEEAHPDAAARLWSTQGLRIVQAKLSRYYDAALADFERARRCYDAAGLPGEWQRIVAFVRVEHRRKRGFMDGFEEVVAGGGPSQRPSFLERAKARGEGAR